MSADAASADAGPGPVASEPVAPTRFEPPVGAESGPFWEATREGRLLVQWCTPCDRGVFFPDRKSVV